MKALPGTIVATVTKHSWTIFAILFGIGLCISLLGLLLPMHWNLGELQTRLSNIDKQLQQRRMKLHELQKDNAEAAPLQSEYFDKLAQLPQNTSGNKLAEELNRLSSRHQLRFEAFRPGVGNADGLYRESPLEVRLNGNFENLVAFTRELSELPYPLNIELLNLRPVADSTDDSPRLGIVLQMKKYCCADDSTPAGTVLSSPAPKAPLFVNPGVKPTVSPQPPARAAPQQQEPPVLETPFEVTVLPLRFADAEQLAAILKQMLGGHGTAISVDTRTNSLVIGADEKILEQLQRTVIELDIPVRQVLIEALIVIATEDFSKRLGVEWQLQAGKIPPPGNNELTVSSAEQFSGTFDLGFFNDHARLKVTLEALQNSGAGEIISRPRLITGDRRSASIKSGTRIPYQESAPNGRTAVRFQDAVLRLEVTPVITPDDKIMLELIINQDSPGPTVNTGGGQATSIATTELRTQVLLGEGQTVALGGVFRDELRKSIARIPVLSSIPVAGKLFRRRSSGKIKSETLIFITPHILPGE